MYFNNLLSSFQSHDIIAYTDDVTIVTHGNPLAERIKNMEHQLTFVHNWSEYNMLLINPSKFQAMILSPFVKKSHTFVISPASIQFGSSLIIIVENIKILDVTLTHDFCWKFTHQLYNAR